MVDAANWADGPVRQRDRTMAEVRHPCRPRCQHLGATARPADVSVNRAHAVAVTTVPATPTSPSGYGDQKGNSECKEDHRERFHGPVPDLMTPDEPNYVKAVGRRDVPIGAHRR